MKSNILDNVIKVVRESNGISSIEIAKKIKLDRHTTAKYLEVLNTNGAINFRKIGMAKVWYPSESPLLSLFESDGEVGTSLRKFLDSFDDTVNIIDKNMKIVYVNKGAKNVKNATNDNTRLRCYKIYQDGKKLCKYCVVDKTLRTGKRQTSVDMIKDERGRKTQLKLTTIPIKNYKNDTVGVIELMNKVGRK